MWTYPPREPLMRQVRFYRKTSLITPVVVKRYPKTTPWGYKRGFTVYLTFKAFNPKAFTRDHHTGKKQSLAFENRLFLKKFN
jgi:hypothetical protein